MGWNHQPFIASCFQRTWESHVFPLRMCEPCYVRHIPWEIKNWLNRCCSKCRCFGDANVSKVLMWNIFSHKRIIWYYESMTTIVKFDLEFSIISDVFRSLKSEDRCWWPHIAACSSQPFMIFIISPCSGWLYSLATTHLQDPDLDEIPNDLGPAGQALSETMIRGGWAPWMKFIDEGWSTKRLAFLLAKLAKNWRKHVEISSSPCEKFAMKKIETFWMGMMKYLTTEVEARLRQEPQYPLWLKAAIFFQEVSPALMIYVWYSSWCQSQK